VALQKMSAASMSPYAGLIFSLIYAKIAA
jgi:hypothetical protein